MLSRKGNPEIKSIFNLLHSMGLKLTVEPKSSAPKSRTKKAA
jgi:DNA-binding phage protein